MISIKAIQPWCAISRRIVCRSVKAGVFELGLSEVALYGGYNRPMEWRYLNPFLPYYWEQYNRGGDDNMFLGIDLAVYWPSGRAFLVS